MLKTVYSCRFSFFMVTFAFVHLLSQIYKTMKKFLFPIAAIAFSLAACDSTPKYVINGTVEGDETGNVYLLKRGENAMDTLAQAAITNGKFVLTGTTTDITYATIAIQGKRATFPILLENATYTASLSTKSPMESKIEGTAEQRILNEFSDVNNQLRAAQSKFYKEYSVAAEAKDSEKLQALREAFEQLVQKGEAKQDSINKANLNTYAAAYILTSQMGRLDAEVLNQKFSELGPKAQASDAGQRISDRIKKLSAVAVGQVAPDFTLNTPEGKPLSMHSIKAKVKIIDFWASWCGPCRGENPNVVKIYKEFHAKGLEILGVSLDNNKENWMKAIEDDQLTWNHVSDLQGWACAAAQLYAVNGIPHMVVLDENNVIVAKNLRGDALRAKVAEMLK